MTALLGAVATGASGMAKPAAVVVANRTAEARNLDIEKLRELLANGAKELTAGRKGDTGANFRNCLIDQSQGTFAVAAFVRGRLCEFCARRLQQGDCLGHVGLRADRIANAHACRDAETKQEFARKSSGHSNFSSAYVSKGDGDLS